jgi:hypothetical protein
MNRKKILIATDHAEKVRLTSMRGLGVEVWNLID